MTVAAFKRGSTFALAVRLHPVVSGVPVADLTGWTATAQLRRANGALIGPLTVDWTDRAERLVTLRASKSDTAAWPLAVVSIDIALTSPDGETTISSGTVTLTVSERITR